MESNETTAASSEGIHIPERVIPAPKSISAEAQAALNSVRPTMPPYPETDDKPAWRDLVRQFNTNLVEMIREQVTSVPGRVSHETIAEVPVYVAEPESIPPENRDKAMVFFHGGSLVMGGGEAVGLFARLEAFKNRCRVYAVDFGNPPDHPYPGALNDGVAVYNELLKDYAPSQIVISGASGGGNLAAAIPLKARNLGAPLPGAIGLFTPQADLTESGDSFQTNEKIDVLGGSLAALNALYANGHDLTDPYVSPLFGDFAKGFPPVFIQTGTRDMFLSNAVRLHRAMRSAGVDAELHVGEAMPHGGFGGGLYDLPEDHDLRIEFLRFLSKHVGWAEPQG